MIAAIRGFLALPPVPLSRSRPPSTSSHRRVFPRPDLPRPTRRPPAPGACPSDGGKRFAFHRATSRIPPAQYARWSLPRPESVSPVCRRLRSPDRLHDRRVDARRPVIAARGRPIPWALEHLLFLAIGVHQMDGFRLPLVASTDLRCSDDFHLPPSHQRYACLEHVKWPGRHAVHVQPIMFDTFYSLDPGAGMDQGAIRRPAEVQIPDLGGNRKQLATLALNRRRARDSTDFFVDPSTTYATLNPSGRRPKFGDFRNIEFFARPCRQDRPTQASVCGKRDPVRTGEFHGHRFIRSITRRFDDDRGRDRDCGIPDETRSRRDQRWPQR